MVRGRSRYGEFRWGEGEEPPESADTRAAQLEAQRGEVVVEHPTAAEAFGSGLQLAGARTTPDDDRIPWDLVVNEHGSLATVSGVDMLAQDLAFALSRELQPLTNTRPDPATLDEYEYDIKSVVERDERVERVPDEGIDIAVTGVDTIKTTLDVIAADGERHSVVVPVAPA